YAVSHARVGGPYGASQPIIGIVGDCDGLCSGAERFHGDDRAEAFFDNSRIIGCARIYYRWRIEISVLVLWSTPGTSGAQARASSNTPVNVVGDFLAMLSRDQWSGF